MNTSCLTLPHLCLHFCWDYSNIRSFATNATNGVFSIFETRDPRVMAGFPDLQPLATAPLWPATSLATWNESPSRSRQPGCFSRGGCLTDFQTKVGSTNQVFLGGEVFCKLVKNIQEFKRIGWLIFLTKNQSIWNSTAHCRSTGMRRQQVKMEKVHSKNLSSQMVWLTS